MGQRVSPISLRFDSVSRYLTFQQLSLLFKGNLFYSFFSFSFSCKSQVGNKLGSRFALDHLIESYFIKLLCFVNKVAVFESSFISLVFVEFFSFKRVSHLFNKVIALLKVHFESLYLDQRPVKLFILNLSDKDKFQSRTFINQAKVSLLNKSFLGANNLFNVGLLCNSWPCAKLFVNISCYFFRVIVNHQILLNFIDQLFSFLFSIKQSSFTGLRLEVKGRVNFSDKTQLRIISYGSLPLQTVTFDSGFLDFWSSHSITSYGTFGLKSYFSYSIINKLA